MKVSCANCKHWNQRSIHANNTYKGQCMACMDYGDSLAFVDDDIQAYSPHLITKPEFFCASFQRKKPQR